MARFWSSFLDRSKARASRLFRRKANREPRGNDVSPPAAPVPNQDLISASRSPTPTPEPASTPQTTANPASSPPGQAVSSVPQPLHPTALPPAQPVVGAPAGTIASDTTASRDVDPWARAYEIFEKREPGLAADYKTHLASLQPDGAAGADLSDPRSVESAVKQLLEDREKKQWRISLPGKDVKVREQAERLAKFLLWADPVVKSALGAQPFAALAWSGVTLLLPVSTYRL